jgi:hypothetical protein
MTVNGKHMVNAKNMGQSRKHGTWEHAAAWYRFVQEKCLKAPRLEASGPLEIERQRAQALARQAEDGVGEGRRQRAHAASPMPVGGSPAVTLCSFGTPSLTDASTT